MFKSFLISIGLMGFLVIAEPNSKPLQTTTLENTKMGFQVLVKPLEGHHFNLEAPTKVKKNEMEMNTIKMTSTSLLIPLTKDDLDKKQKCELQIQTYVCDDKKTFCSPQSTNLTCAKLPKPSASMATEGSGSVAVTTLPQSESVAITKSPDIFILNDPKLALENAAKSGKPLFIDFFGTWCPPCNVLDETVFTSKVFQTRGKDFVLLKLDVDEKISWELKSKFRVKGYPTVVLATPNGDEITRFVGAIPEVQIINLMNLALKNKNTSLANARDQYQSKPTSKQALAIINTLISNDDFPTAVVYVPEALKSKSLSLSEKEMLLLIPMLALPKEKTEAIAKSILPLVKDMMISYPVSDLYLQKVELLQDLAKTIKDDALTKWIHETNIKTIQATLAQSKLNFKNLTKIDLLGSQTDSFENLGQTENEKKSYAEMASEYSKLIAEHNQNPKTNRGFNLERVYCLYKSGSVQEAREEYEKLISVYPNEFTFHYNYASVLKDLKDWDKALESAQKALQFSYGDNQLRAIYLVSEIESKKGHKKDSIDRLTKAIETTELPKDETVRTHRYVKKLVELKKKIQDDKMIN